MPPPSDAESERVNYARPDPLLHDHPLAYVEKVDPRQMFVGQALQMADDILQLRAGLRRKTAIRAELFHAYDLAKSQVARAEEPATGDVWQLIEQFVAIVQT